MERGEHSLTVWDDEKCSGNRQVCSRGRGRTVRENRETSRGGEWEEEQYPYLSTVGGT